MRRLTPLFALVILAGCTTLAPTPAPPAAHFRILQVNDVYKIEGLEGGKIGGLARLRELRRHLESDGTALLVLHAGDALYPSVMSKHLEARPMVDVMNLLDGDSRAFDPGLIVTFGNHEFDNRDPDVLLARLRDSQFSWVSSNTLQCDPECDGRFPGVAENVVRDIDGIRVGILAVTYPLKKSYVQTTDPLEAAAAEVKKLRQAGADFVVALTHQDMPADAQLVRDVPGIDLVVGGHDHIFLQEQVGDTWITKADADALSVIVHDVTVPRCAGRRAAGCEPRSIPLRISVDASIPKDERVAARVSEWLEALGEKLGGNETLGTTRNLLEGTEPVIRGRETALGNFLADIAREQMNTDVALLNGGGIRINDNIPPGPITRYDLEGIFLFSNRLVAFRARGADILEMLRTSVSEADSADGRFLQVSGLSFAYSKQGNAFTVAPEDVLVNGERLDLERTYTVATTDFIYTRGVEDDYMLFAEATRPPKVNEEREIDFREAVEKWIRAKRVVDVAVEGRIVRR